MSFWLERPSLVAVSMVMRGGELMTMTVAGEEVKAEYVSLHPPYVVERYASDAIIGVVGWSKAN